MPNIRVAVNTGTRSGLDQMACSEAKLIVVLVFYIHSE